jgi:hypothetical protein
MRQQPRTAHCTDHHVHFAPHPSCPFRHCQATAHCIWQTQTPAGINGLPPAVHCTDHHNTFHHPLCPCQVTAHCIWQTQTPAGINGLPPAVHCTDHHDTLHHPSCVAVTVRLQRTVLGRPRRQQGSMGCLLLHTAPTPTDTLSLSSFQNSKLT